MLSPGRVSGAAKSPRLLVPRTSAAEPARFSATLLHGLPAGAVVFAYGNPPPASADAVPPRRKDHLMRRRYTSGWFDFVGGVAQFGSRLSDAVRLVRPTSRRHRQHKSGPPQRAVGNSGYSLSGILISSERGLQHARLCCGFLLWRGGCRREQRCGPGVSSNCPMIAYVGCSFSKSPARSTD